MSVVSSASTRRSAANVPSSAPTAMPTPTAVKTRRPQSDEHRNPRGDEQGGDDETQTVTVRSVSHESGEGNRPRHR
jgi:hypothetical protein